LNYYLIYCLNTTKSKFNQIINYTLLNKKMSKQYFSESEISNSPPESNSEIISNSILSDISSFSAPAPEPEPAPSPEIVCAEPVSTFIPECRISVGKIIIKITDTIDKINYVRHLTEKSDIWLRNSKYFPDFNSFYIAIHTSLKNENEYVESKISKSGHQEITIVFTHEGLHSFIIPIILQKEEDRIDRMEKNIERLFSENKYLKEQIDEIKKSLLTKDNSETSVIVKKQREE